jgi:hypothetical protein
MRLTLIVVGSLVSAGCTYQSSYTTADQDRSVTPATGATGLRNFDQTVATFSDGGTVAGSTTFAYEPTRFQDEWKYLYADTGTFLINFFTFPVTLFREAPDKVFDGLIFEPSHTMNPSQPWATESMAVAPPATTPADVELLAPEPVGEPQEAPNVPAGVTEITP